MDELEMLKAQLNEAHGWCDHNGDHGTGYVSLTVDTLEAWITLAEDAYDYLLERVGLNADA